MALGVSRGSRRVEGVAQGLEFNPSCLIFSWQKRPFPPTSFLEVTLDLDVGISNIKGKKKLWVTRFFPLYPVIPAAIPFHWN